ncbi:MAG: hypothetical protein GX902_00500 [Lentisphaerae bacterium]|nr:hypothetical protein [Lentisphaerota bacterium]
MAKQNYSLGRLSFTLADELLQLQFCGDYCCRTHLPELGGITLAAFGTQRLEGSALRCRQVTASPLELSFQLQDAAGTVAIQSVWKLCPQSGLFSRRDRICNTSSASIVLRRFLARFPFAAGDYEVYAQHSRWGRESQGQWCAFNSGTLKLAHRWGRTTEGGAPYAAVREKYCRHALALHVIPNGKWCLKFRQYGFSNLKPMLIAELGQDDEDFQLTLAPGESFEAPEILLQLLPGREVESGTAELHRYLLEHLAPAVPPLPVVYNTWLDRMTTLEVPRLRQQLAAARAIGCEVFVVDAGWFRCLGDWRELENKAFQGQMSQFADEVRAAGLRFGIWLDGEAFSALAPVIQEHPEYFVSSNPNATGLLGGNYRIDAASPAGRDYLFALLSGLIQKYNLGYLKFDMNNSSGYDCSGAELAAFSRGWFSVIEQIRHAFPDLILENCASGALRTDLQTLKFFSSHFISDNANIYEVLRITQGMFLRFLPGRLFRWLVTTSTGDFRPHGPETPAYLVQPNAATWLQFSTYEAEFGLLATAMGVMGFSGDLDALPPEARKTFAAVVQRYKQHRQAIQNSEGTLLTPVESMNRPEGWLVFQLFDRSSGELNIFAFHKVCDGDCCRIFHPCGLPPDWRGRDASGRSYSAAQLQEHGIQITFEYNQHGDFQAQWLSYKRSEE